jgi:short-subunit dehydrogenase
VVINNAGVGYRSFVELSKDEEIDNIVGIFLGGKGQSRLYTCF